MTKKEMIERYGQAYYDAHLAKSREAAKAHPRTMMVNYVEAARYAAEAA